MRSERTLRLLLLLAAALAFVPAALAKEFEPGDLRLCNADRCVAVMDQGALTTLGAFYYGSRKPPRSLPPPLGVPYYELRFRNGYATGIVATSRLDRFLSYGVNLGQFARGRWYRVPTRAAVELRRLSGSLEPLRLTRAAIRKSR
jgi:hypothetical protein